MKTQEVANRLVSLCREGKFQDAQNELYADNAWSHEPDHRQMPSVQGRENITAKGKQWSDSVAEFHGAEISEPVVAGNRFAVALNMDVTYKNSGRVPMQEIGIYEVEDGKIVSERFVY